MRISGLFRDVFPKQIALFDSAVRAVAQLDETPEDNPLAGDADPRRIFGAAPGAYGVDLSGAFAGANGATAPNWRRTYLAANAQNYGATARPLAGAAISPRASRTADAFVHVQDMAGQDVLDADAFAEHEGGFAAAADYLGARPGSITSTPRGRTPRKCARLARRCRASSARAPPIRAGSTARCATGHRGAAEIAETVDNLFAFAALTDAVERATSIFCSTPSAATRTCATFSSAPIRARRRRSRKNSARPSGAGYGCRGAIPPPQFSPK